MIVIVETRVVSNILGREKQVRSKLWWCSTEAARWMLDERHLWLTRHDGPAGTRS